MRHIFSVFLSRQSLQRLCIAVIAAVLALSFALSPSNAQAKTEAQMTLAEQTVSYAYLNALRWCVANSQGHLIDNSWAARQDRISESNARSGTWFQNNTTWNAIELGAYTVPASYLSPSNDTDTNNTEGKALCNNVVKEATRLWGYSDSLALMCDFVSYRANNSSCATGSDSFGQIHDYANRLYEAVKKKVYGGDTPSLSIDGGFPGRYLLYKEAFLKGCKAVPSSNAASGFKYDNIRIVNDDGTHSDIDYEGRNRSDKVNVYVDRDNLAWISKTCGEIADEVNKYADVYAKYRADNSDEPSTPPGGGSQNLCSTENPPADCTTTSATTCAVTGTGWIVCAVSRTLAEMMSGIWGLLVAFLEVPALNTDVNSEANFTYKIWETMRNIANIAFVVAFMIIIFSQLTGAGVSNYGVKKLLPRLIVSAILVNVSYWLCAILVDLSNIAGAGIHNLIKTITDNAGAVHVSTSVWEDVIGGLLAGGTLTFSVAAGIAVAAAPAAGPVVGALLWTALPALLSVLLVAIVCFAILAARQGLLIILIILSPLAFVAFLLPNTENLFNLWRKSLTTMLVFFPIFAIIFAGSQLAGLAIIASTGTIEAGDQSPRAALLILGLFVQVAPLAITPLLIRFSGGLIGQLAGIVNNRGKGLIDRSRNVAERKRRIAIGETLGSRTALNNRFTRGTAGVLRRMYRGVNNSALRDADRQKAIDSDKQLAYAETGRPQELYDRINNNQEQLKTLDTRAETARLQSNVTQNIQAELHDAELEADTIKAEQLVTHRENQNQEMAYRLQTAKHEGKALDAVENQLFRESLSTSQPAQYAATDRARAAEGQLKVAHDATASAEGMLQQEYATQLQENKVMAATAGGIDPYGAQRVVARATQTVNEAHNKAVAAEQVLVREFASKPEKIAAAGNNPATGQPYTANEYLVDLIRSRTSTSGQPATQEQIEAMVQHVVKTGTAADVMQLTNVMAEPQFSHKDPARGAENSEILQTFGEAVGASGKIKSIGGADFGTLAQGKQIPGYKDHIVKTVTSKKYKADSFASMDIDEIKAIHELLTSPDPSDMARVAAIPLDAKISLNDAIEQRLTDPRLQSTLNDRDRKALSDIQAAL